LTLDKSGEILVNMLRIQQGIDVPDLESVTQRQEYNLFAFKKRSGESFGKPETLPIRLTHTPAACSRNMSKGCFIVLSDYQMYWN